jgi:MYXO-CTERM domain-containing protein
MNAKWLRGLIACCMGCLLLAPALGSAQDRVSVDDVRLDPPTLVSLGVQVLISGDDDGDASAELRYRKKGVRPWEEASMMLRVYPDTVVGHSVADQFAGSALDLEPDTVYELEVRVQDPDGAVDETFELEAKTRAVPPDEPAQPRQVDVADASELRTALGQAQPGDVITLAEGVYNGSFSLSASGTADDPIVIRGASRDATILDGEDCGCNVVEVYGSFVHVERLTIRDAVRALRFQDQGAEHNVVRDVRIEDVVHGVGSKPDQKDFYICDNLVHGRLEWPLISPDDGAQHNDDQGIRVDGDGHVVCHNEIKGFGDPMLNFAQGHRANDFYGNDVFDIYGDGVELDRAEGNVRLFRNRFTNVYTAISIQPVYGGPVYVLRNEVVNVADEQIKLKSVGTTEEPSGALIFHNTFVSPEVALNLQTPITQHNFRIENNLFIGPDTTARDFTVDWTATIDRGNFNYNGYYPDGSFWFGKDMSGTNQLWSSFAEVQAAGVYETHGSLVASSPFASGFRAPTDYRTRHTPQVLALDSGSAAVDKGRTLAGINDGFAGAAPDLGAIEDGCDEPFYGPRADTTRRAPIAGCDGAPGGGGGDDTGVDEDAGSADTGGDDAGSSNDTGSGVDIGVDSGGSGDDAGSIGDDAGSDTGSSDLGVGPSGDGSSGGCGGCSTGPAGSPVGWLFFLIGLAGLRRRWTLRNAASLICAASLIGLVGCDDADSNVDAGTDVGHDAGDARDAGDAGDTVVPDAGDTGDAGDTVAPDAGDTSTPDAGDTAVPDAGDSGDATTRDATDDTGVDAADVADAADTNDIGDASGPADADARADAGDADATADADAGPVVTDPFDPQSCSGTAWTEAEALARLGANSSEILDSQTVMERRRTCDSSGCGPWGSPTINELTYLTYSGGVTTRYKTLQTDTTLVLFDDGGTPKLSVRHDTHLGRYPNDHNQGIVFGLPPAQDDYPRMRAWNENPDHQYDYRDLEQYLGRDAQLFVSSSCARFEAVSPDRSSDVYAEFVAVYRY